ncbi:hypothetical protein [uncultured Stenotrophomonas sp.]|uniref:hypothetical protein n=1 Tax=uncultured Stenotrophomonas sp. TaxID=165438 RepID=UPI0025FCBCDA|nr:hypothetical protein [uncultured Stenotrophomonas sp.]
MKYISLAIGITILLAYSMALWKWKRSEILPWFHTACATVASILIGAFTAIALFDYQESSKQEADRARYHALLSVEISGIRAHLLKPTGATVELDNLENIDIRVMHLRAEVLRDAGRSGLFDIQQSQQMLELAQSVEAWNMKTEGLIGALNAQSGQPQYGARIRWYSSNLESSREGLLEGVRWLSQNMELENYPAKMY